jgi:hypothetical protein
MVSKKKAGIQGGREKIWLISDKSFETFTKYLTMAGAGRQVCAGTAGTSSATTWR